MIGKNLGLNNRRNRRAANRELRRKGLAAKSVAPERVRSRALALTDYIRDADRAQLRKLKLTREESHAALIYIADVAGTIAELQQIEPGEKVDVIGFRNFRSDDFVRCQREIVATMMRSPGIDPLEHYVIAWKAHEQPTTEQVHAAAETFLNVMGLNECQTIYAAHANTANYHLHIAANRVHPKSGQRIAAGGDWQVDTLHQALAIIEHEQGWASEPNALYRANENGVFHNETNIQVRDAKGVTGQFPNKKQRAEGRARSVAEEEKLPVAEQLSEGARAYERRTQCASFERIAKTVVSPILRAARSWGEVHERLAEQGFEYEKGGTGARIRWGDRTLSASTSDRSAALKQMEGRKGFGPFVARSPGVGVARRASMPLELDSVAQKYKAERQAYAAAVETLKGHLREQSAAVAQSVDAIQDCVLADVNSIDWAGSGVMLNVARGVASHGHRLLTGVITEQFRAAAGALPTVLSFPSLDAWSAGNAPPALPSSANITMPAMLMSPGYGSAPLPIQLHHYRRVAVGRSFHHLDAGGKTAIRDLGDLVVVDQANDPAAVRLALLLAQKKWGSVAIVSGDAAFRDLCSRIAVEEGVTLTGVAAPEVVTPARSHEQPQNTPEISRSQVASRSDQSDRETLPIAPSNAPASEVMMSIYGDFPFLHDPPVETDRRPAREFVGLHALVDAWLAVHRGDAQDFSRLRPLASRIMRVDDARAIAVQMEAEGCLEGERIRQQAQFYLRQQAAQKAMVLR